MDALQYNPGTASPELAVPARAPGGEFPERILTPLQVSPWIKVESLSPACYLSEKILEDSGSIIYQGM